MEITVTKKYRADFYHSVQKKFDLPYPTNSQKLKIQKTVSLRLVRSLDSSLGIVTRLRVGRWVIRVLFTGRGQRIYSIASRPAVGYTEPPTGWVPNGLFRGLKDLRGDADHHHNYHLVMN
jgi:hypothetical protein